MAGGRTLTVYLAADTKAFKGGLSDAEQQASGFGGRLSSLGDTIKSSLGPALAGAAIAAGALAVKFAVDGVQGAMEEEAELAKLSNTLTNLGFDKQIENVNSFIDAQARATTFSDSDLRPAFERLAGATKDVGSAMDLTRLATDLAVGSNVSLDTASKALAKAVDGNTGALKKLAPGLDEATLKSGDLDAITKMLSERFAGQASSAADTWQGKIGNLSEAFDELKESFGKGFLDAIDNADSAFGPDGLTGTMYNLQPAIEDVGSTVGETAVAISDIIGWVDKAKNSFDDWYVTLDGFNKMVVDSVLQTINTWTGGIISLRDAIQNALDLWYRLTGQAGGASIQGANVSAQAAAAASRRISDLEGTVSGLQAALTNANKRTTGSGRLVA